MVAAVWVVLEEEGGRMGILWLHVMGGKHNAGTWKSATIIDGCRAWGSGMMVVPSDGSREQLGVLVVTFREHLLLPNS